MTVKAAFIDAQNLVRLDVEVDDPPPPIWAVPAPKPFREFALTVKEALAKTTNTKMEPRLFYRVMGIASLVYVENGQLAVAYLVKPHA